MAKDLTQFKNLREAYCAVHRCRNEDFERKVLWRCFPLHVQPFALVFWVIERTLFQRDLESIRAAGQARSSEELESVVNEFENLMGVERGFRRGTLHICIRGRLLGRRLEPLLPSIIGFQAAPTLELPIRAIPLDSREPGSLTIRRLRKFRDDIIQGREISNALKESGWTESDLRGLVSAQAPGRPDLIWLSGYLGQLDELSTLRRENERLTRVAAELSARVLELEERLQLSK
jgi:hypothetical protein